MTAMNDETKDTLTSAVQPEPSASETPAGPVPAAEQPPLSPRRFAPKSAFSRLG